MKPDIARSIYERRYSDSLKFDEYYKRLETGMALLVNNTLERNCSYKELADMQFALEYCEEMLAMHME